MIVPKFPAQQPGGMVSRLRATIDGPLWPYIVERYGFEAWADGRSMALDVLAEIADVDVQVLDYFARHTKSKGWEYVDFAKKMKQAIVRPGADDSIGVLSEYGLVSLTAASDCNGWFVVVTWPSQSRHHRRLLQLILRRWFLEERDEQLNKPP